MARITVNTEIDTQKLLAELAHLRLSELEEFAKELNTYIKRKRANDRVTKDKALLLRINQTVLPPQQRATYLQLVQKLEAETITEAERQLCLTLATKEEQLRNERITLMIELAKLRGVSFRHLMEDLGLEPIRHIVHAKLAKNAKAD